MASSARAPSASRRNSPSTSPASPGVNTVSPARHPAYGVEQLLARRRLHQVAGRARLHRLEHVLLLAATPTGSAPARTGRAATTSAVTSTPFGLGDLQVEHHDLRAGPPGTGRSPRCPSAATATTSKPGLGQVALDRVAPHRVVVDHHHPASARLAPLAAVPRRAATGRLQARRRATYRPRRCTQRLARPRRSRPRSTTQVTSSDQPTVRGRLQRDAGPGATSATSRGPHAVCSNSRHPERAARRRARPRRTPRPGRGAPTPAACTTARPVALQPSRRGRSRGRAAPAPAPGSPAATISDVTVSPARPRSSAAVHSVTAPPRRPRRRRTGSGSGSRNGCPLWIVTGEGTAEPVTRGYDELPLGALTGRRCQRGRAAEVGTRPRIDSATPSRPSRRPRSSRPRGCPGPSSRTETTTASAERPRAAPRPRASRPDVAGARCPGRPDHGHHLARDRAPGSSTGAARAPRPCTGAATAAGDQACGQVDRSPERALPAAHAPTSCCRPAPAAPPPAPPPAGRARRPRPRARRRAAAPAPAPAAPRRAPPGPAGPARRRPRRRARRASRSRGHPAAGRTGSPRPGRRGAAGRCCRSSSGSSSVAHREVGGRRPRPRPPGRRASRQWTAQASTGAHHPEAGQGRAAARVALARTARPAIRATATSRSATSSGGGAAAGAAYAQVATAVHPTMQRPRSRARGRVVELVAARRRSSTTALSSDHDAQHRRARGTAGLDRRARPARDARVRTPSALAGGIGRGLPGLPGRSASSAASPAGRLLLAPCRLLLGPAWRTCRRTPGRRAA